MPGCHDVLSAKIIENAGFEAVQVRGFGLAGSLPGKPDVGLVDMKDILDITGHITRAVPVPVMADIDTGGNALKAASINTSTLRVHRVWIPRATGGLMACEQVYNTGAGV